MNRRRESAFPSWFNKPRSTSTASLLPSGPQMTLTDSSECFDESGDVRLPELTMNLVTFSLPPTDLSDSKPPPRPVEEPQPPSGLRLVLGACLVVLLLSATALTLGLLDLPFTPPKQRARSLLEEQGAPTAALKEGSGPCPEGVEARGGSSVVRHLCDENSTQLLDYRPQESTEVTVEDASGSTDSE